MNRLHLAACRPSRPSTPLRAGIRSGFPAGIRSGRMARTAATGAAALALAACGALPSPGGAPAGDRASAGPGTAVTPVSSSVSASVSAPAHGPAPVPGGGARHATAPPRYFADIVLGSIGGEGTLQVRDSATGRLVAQGRQQLDADLAALADGRTFVVAEPVGSSCFTRLYRQRISAQGQLGRLIRLPVPELHGSLVSLAASGNGSVLGFAVTGCAKGKPGYIGVVHVPSGRTTRWGNVNLGGESPGNVELNDELSLSANGLLLAIPAFALSANSTIIGQDLRVLPVDAPPGTVAQRSRIVRSSPYPPYSPLLVAAALSPGGRALYACQTLGRAVHAVRLSAYRTSTGRLRRTLATLTVTGMPLSAAGYCPVALDGPGQHLLVPYAIRYPRDPEAGPKLRIARMTISTGRIAVLTVRLPAGGMQPASGMLIAW
jgi:hypothetical protein